MADSNAIHENSLPSKSPVNISDQVRVIGANNASYKALVTELAKCLIETYEGTTLAGSPQPVQRAINALHSSIEVMKSGLAVAETASQMTDEENIYVYVGSETGWNHGDWYYWNGTVWTSGGSIGSITPDKTLTQDGVAADAKTTGDTLALKANTEGEIAMAKALVGGKYTLDQSPYHYRQSPDAGSLDEKIVGGTLGWNQLVENGDFSNGTTGWGFNNCTATASNNRATVTVSAETKSINFGLLSSKKILQTVGHKYLYRFNIKVSDTSMGTMRYNVNGTSYPSKALTAGIDTLVEGIVSATSTETRMFVYPWGTAPITASGNETIEVHDYNMFDLTTLFGSTIADYIYSLEQATAGAGVDWVRQYIDIDSYHEYCEPTLKSVEGLQSRDVVGFNQWDEEWEVGGINHNTGANNNSVTNVIRTKNYIPCVPNASYFFCMSGGASEYIHYYDADKNYIRYAWVSKNATFVTPNNAHYIRVHPDTTYGTTYNHDICINLSDPSKNGTYEPYEKHSYPLDSSLELMGIPKLSDGKMYFDGDEYQSDGQVTRRYGIVDLGTLNYGYNSESSQFYTMQAITGMKTGLATSEIPPFICAKYPSSGIGASRIPDKTIGTGTSGGKSSGVVIIGDSSYTDTATFKTAMSGVMLVYELATPTTETATPFQSPQLAGTTEEYVTTGVVPVGHESHYYEDITGKVNNLPSDFSTLIAPVEKSFTATRNYTVGSFVIVNNQLYKVTSAISSGGTITPNSNCTATTIMAEILALA